MNDVDCERAQLLINARLDGELVPGDPGAAALDAHLAACPTCRAAADDAAGDDASLRRAFAPRRDAAERVAEAAVAEIRKSVVRPKGMPPWLRTALAAAAGFLLAVVLLRPWEGPRDGTGPTAVSGGGKTAATALATLALATGAVEVRAAGETEWKAMPTGGSVSAGDVVRTGPRVRCEFATPEGSFVRVNEQTELAFRQPRLFELAAGQVWSTVARAAEPFRVRVPRAEVTALGTQFDLTCHKAGDVATLTVVEGSTRVNDLSGEKVVRSGEQLTIQSGRSEAPSPAGNLIVATRWVNEILVMKGRDNAELARRIDDLFAQIGRSKMAYMYEEEIRALGDHSVVPLTRYLCAESTTRPDDDAKRRDAARILADVAQPWSAGELIRLLPDRDGEVRYHAARALHRVTRWNPGRSPEQWRDEPPEKGREALEQWKQWWATNRDRFPGLPPS